MAKPRVSVIMTVFNGEKFLSEAIDSILRQTLSDFELIIIDDGSADRSAEIIKSYDDPRIKLTSQRNQGQIKAMRQAIKHAEADYLARMDADDISEPTRLQLQVNFLNQHPETALVGSSFRLIDEKTGREISVESVFTENEDLQRMLFLRNPFAHGSIMMRAAAYQASGGYNEEYAPAEDYDLWCRLAKNHELGAIPKILYTWRVNPGGLSHTRSRLSAANAQRIKQAQWSKSLPEPVPAQQMRQRAQYYKSADPTLGILLKPRYLESQIMIGLALIRHGRPWKGLKNLGAFALVGKSSLRVAVMFLYSRIHRGIIAIKLKPYSRTI